MKLPITIDGEVLYAEIPDEEINKLIANKKKKTGYERNIEADIYYSTDHFLETEPHIEYLCEYDNDMYDCANYFSDKSVAENMARAQKLWNQINRRSVELCEPHDIKTMENVYIITYSRNNNKIISGEWAYVYPFGAVSFNTKEHCQQVIDEFHDDLLWYFTEFKNRADM